MGPWGGDSDKGEWDKGTHKCSEEGPAPILRIWEDPECPFPAPADPLCPTPPHPKSRPPFFTVTIYSSFLFLFVRNGHKNQCKTISVGVVLYYKTLDI